MAAIPPLAQTTTAWRFERNLGAYLSGVLTKMRVAHQMLASNDFEERTAPVVVEIDAHSDLKDMEMGVMQSSSMLVRVSGQVDEVKSRAHKDIVARLYAAMFCVPKPDARTLWASPQCLLALNFTVGKPDRRREKLLHVWDLVGPSSSLGQTDSTADTIIVATANFTGANWDGAQPYGQ